MLRDFAIGLPTMAVCLVLQALIIIVAARIYIWPGPARRAPTFASSLGVMTAVMILLVAGNLLQMAVWAIVFVMLGEFAEFSEAFYHSAVNFATLGYGDIVMSAGRRLLGPLEAINGGLMIGVTSAALITAFQDLKTRLEAARGAGPGERP
jgi:hypothetical protein